MDTRNDVDRGGHRHGLAGMTANRKEGLAGVAVVRTELASCTLERKFVQRNTDTFYSISQMALV